MSCLHFEIKGSCVVFILRSRDHALSSFWDHRIISFLPHRRVSLKKLYEGSIWFECSLLPYLLIIPLPMTLSKTSILLCGLADGRTYLVFVKYLLHISILFFNFIFPLFRILGKNIYEERKSWRHVLLEKNQISILNFVVSQMSFTHFNNFCNFYFIILRLLEIFQFIKKCNETFLWV